MTRLNWPGVRESRRARPLITLPAIILMVLLSQFGSAFAQLQLPVCPKVDSKYWTNCIGAETLRNGAKYVGEYFNGQAHGQGTLITLDGYKYVGEWRFNKINGRGTRTFPDGRKYVGQSADGKRNGMGTEYNADGTVSRRGFWIDDKYAGTVPPPGHQILNRVTSFVDGEDLVQRVPLLKLGSNFVLRLELQGSFPLDFALAAERSDTLIPASLVGVLIRMGKITEKDFLDSQKSILSSGTNVKPSAFIIHSLKIGDVVISNVLASASGSIETPVLGRNVLGRLKRWSIDEAKREFTFEAAD